MKDKLRRLAEKRYKAEESQNPTVLSPDEMQLTVNELRTHQIELELQNEELRRIRAELETVRERYFNLYNLAPVGYVTLSARGLLLEANDTFANMLGVARTDLVRQPLSRFIFPEDQDILYHFRRKLSTSGEPRSCELRLVREGAAPFWVKIDATVAPASNDPALYRVVISDISERKAAEDLHKQVEGIIRHDLRSPACNAVNVANLLLESPNLTENQRQLLILLENAGRQMMDTLDRSLDIYKIETGQYQTVPESFDCLSLLRELARNLSNMNKRNPARVILEIDGAPPDQDECFQCRGRPELMQAALRNLLQNAVEASPAGEPVWVRMVSGTRGRIKISNRGAVPPDIRDRFFQKYATSGKAFGTGLGAYSAKRMVEAQGGGIEMRTSDDTDETVITIRMPA